MTRSRLLPVLSLLVVGGCALLDPSGRARALRAGLDRLDRDLDTLADELEAAEDDLARLAAMAERDARVEAAWHELLPAWGNEDVELAERELARRLEAVRVSNAEQLRSMLASVGWFTIPDYGPLADRQAWTIVQHADHDRVWQIEILELLEVLAEVDATDPVHVAYLTDRLLVARGKRQRYGTQGLCRLGGWRPDPIDDRLHVDARRAEVGLPPLEEQIRQASERCP